MTDKYASESKLSPLLKRVLTLLEDFNQSKQGHIYYNHIKQTLYDWEARQDKVISAYSGLVSLLLEAFAAQLPPDSMALTHLKLVQTCLTPPLCDAELNLLKSSVEQAAEMLKNSALVDADRLDNTLVPILKRVLGESDDIVQQYTQSTADSNESNISTNKEGDTPQDADDFDEIIESSLNGDFDENCDIGENPEKHERLVESQNLLLQAQRADADADNVNHINEAKPLKAPKAVLKMLRFPEEFKVTEVLDPPTSEIELSASDSEPSNNSTMMNLPESTSDTEDILESFFPSEDEALGVQEDDDQSDIERVSESHEDNDSRNILLAKSGDDAMERLHRDFVRQMRAIVAENAEFGVHLGLEIDALDDATRIQHVEDRRKAILASMKKLSESHTDLAKKFDSAQNYLSIIESDKRKLSDELDRARMLSLTDELTSLPNRRAFIKRMDDEVSRVKRYGFPLSLVLIDIDHFKQVNDEYGHAAGDVVLKVYADKILSTFRNHDMIARYGGEEFAVLLPNTDLDGVLRALDKVKSAVPNIECAINGTTIPAPTFSAGVTEYRAPESPTRFVERADHALYRAKRLGRNRIEVEHKDPEHGVVDHNL